MSKLKKLTREDLKTLNGGKLLPGGGGYNCGSGTCSGDSQCAAYGLSCGIHIAYNTSGEVSSICQQCV